MKKASLIFLFFTPLLAQVPRLYAQPVVNGKTGTTVEDMTINGTGASNLLQGATGTGLNVIGYTIYGMPGVMDTGVSVIITYPTLTDTVGSLNIRGNGNYQFIPKANYNDTVPLITYTVRDANSLSDTATLKILITAANDGPANTVPSYVVREDGQVTLNTLVAGVPKLSEADPDAGFGLFTISFFVTVDPASNPTIVAVGYGTLTASSTDSVTVTGSGTGQITLNGSLPALNAYLHDGTTAVSPPIIYTTPGNDARTGSGGCIPSLRLVMTSNDNGNTGEPGQPLIGRTDKTVRIITITSVADITADNISAASNTPKAFNVLTGSGGATADSFEAAGRYVSAINGAAFTNGQNIILPSGSSLTVESTGAMIFTSAPGFTGTDTFRYVVTSPDLGCTESARVSITVSASLPAVITGISARETGYCTAELSWQTGVEEAFREFEIEVGTDGIHFEKVASVVARGSDNRYRYELDKAADGINYFRLKMIDIDDQYAYSSIVKASIYCKKLRNIKVYPTLTKNRVQVDGLQKSEAIKLYDASGRLLLEKKVNETSTQLDLNYFMQGLYHVVITTNDNQKKNFKVVKL